LPGGLPSGNASGEGGRGKQGLPGQPPGTTVISDWRLGLISRQALCPAISTPLIPVT